MLFISLQMKNISAGFVVVIVLYVGTNFISSFLGIIQTKLSSFDNNCWFRWAAKIWEGPSRGNIFARSRKDENNCVLEIILEQPYWLKNDWWKTESVQNVLQAHQWCNDQKDWKRWCFKTNGNNFFNLTPHPQNVLFHGQVHFSNWKRLLIWHLTCSTNKS